MKERIVSRFKDKNDKPICEGDIIKAGIWCNGYIREVKAVVRVKNGCFLLKPLKGFGVYSLISISRTRSEIIGNIYDNPELLNEELINEELYYM